MSALNQSLLQARERFLQLAPRERLLLSIAALAVTVTLLFIGLWEPLAKGREAARQQLQSAQALAQRLEQIGAEVRQQGGTRGTAAVNRSVSLLAAVDQAARSGTLGRPPSRLQPEGEREVRVWLENTSFENLLHWISELESRHGIVVHTLDVERSGTTGLVNARLSVVRP